MNQAVQLANAAPEPRVESLWRQRWKRFRRNRLALIAGAVLLLLHLVVLLGPSLYHASPEAVAPLNALKSSSGAHWLGTDELGRDTMARLLYGGRISLAVGFAAMAISVGLGTIVGATAGYFGGIVDMVQMRLTDALMSLPTIFLLLVILTVFKGGLVTVMVVIGITSWMGVARLVRSEMLQSKEHEFVEAAVALGAGQLRVLRKHVLPSAYSSIIVAATLGIARAILVESALSYLGLGIQPPTASLGNMLTNAQTYLWTAPVQALWPGLLILLAVLCFNFLGDGLRDALDPRMKR
ncbi:MAG: binding-protein-dependent transport system inner rane component [Firmicutes bacterium]|nr:binding-protein-dependent transport system inner rane component [Bacillota bacterium]